MRTARVGTNGSPEWRGASRSFSHRRLLRSPPTCDSHVELAFVQQAAPPTVRFLLDVADCLQMYRRLRRVLQDFTYGRHQHALTGLSISSQWCQRPEWPTACRFLTGLIVVVLGGFNALTAVVLFDAGGMQCRLGRASCGHGSAVAVATGCSRMRQCASWRFKLSPNRLTRSPAHPYKRRYSAVRSSQ